VNSDVSFALVVLIADFLMLRYFWLQYVVSSYSIATFHF